MSYWLAFTFTILLERHAFVLHHFYVFYCEYLRCEHSEHYIIITFFLLLLYFFRTSLSLSLFIALLDFEFPTKTPSTRVPQNIRR